ncbi:sericin-2 [Centruroides vittatus]|uniref:sericin-2 n=1 Tax=Centruroides vittatus TaxID=120091 RepID=UPI0035104639
MSPQSVSGGYYSGSSGSMSPQSVSGGYYSGSSGSMSSQSASGGHYSGSSGSMSSQSVSGGHYNGGTSTFTKGGNGKYTVQKTRIVSSPQSTGNSYKTYGTYYRSSSSRVKRDESSASKTTKEDALSDASAKTTSEAVNITRVSNITKKHSTQNMTSVILNGTMPKSLNSSTNMRNVTDVNNLNLHKLSIIPANLTAFNASQSSLSGINNTESMFNKTKFLSVLNGTNSIDTARPQPLKFTLSLSVAVDTPDITDANLKNKK